MSLPVDLKQLTSAEFISGEDQAETLLLQDMLHRAELYLKSFTWCPRIVERYLGYGVGGVVGVFLFRLESKVKGTDDWLWVIEGDLPSAYLVTDEAPDPMSALAVYCDLMGAWAHAVLNGTRLDVVFPVLAPPTSEFANMLLSRVGFIREKLLPVPKGKGEG